MGLFLSRQQMWDMPLGGKDPHQLPHWSGNVIYFVVAAICKVCFRYSVTGRETLRAFQGKSGAVVVCNHTSFFDVVFIYLSARLKQWIRLMGRDSLFDQAGGLFGQILSRVGAFPVERDSSDMTSIKRATRMLKDQELVGILPEGTRRGKSNRVPTLHAGAALVARMGKVPILPMTVRDAENIKQKGRGVRFPKITIEFGHPIVLSDFDFLPKADRLEACTWYAMRETFALSLRVAPEQVDMVALFPDTRDYAPVFAEHPIPARSVDEAIAACA